MNDQTKYIFWLELRDGQEIRWSGLSQNKAVSMHKWTEDSVLWTNVKAYGWEEMR